MRFLIFIILVFISCHGTLEPEQETLPNISYNTYIYNNHWYPASPPGDSTQNIYNRGRMIWYNPYEDELTKNIWPDSSTSTQENNNTTKTLYLETDFPSKVNKQMSVIDSKMPLGTRILGTHLVHQGKGIIWPLSASLNFF